VLADPVAAVDMGGREIGGVQGERAAAEILSYMYRNMLAPNASKTQFMVLGKGDLKDIRVEGDKVQESEQVTFLGLEVNKNMDCSSHTKKVEKEMALRTGWLCRLENFLPKKTLLKVIPGFVCSPATYMLDVYSDITGGEKEAGNCKVLHR
jgi:hypothetical protein